MTRLWMFAAALSLLSAASAFGAEPKSCTQAAEACMAQRVCDIGCKRTCVSRFTGCLKTGAFALNAPRVLLTNLKRN